MIYTRLTETIKKYIYVVSYDKYKSDLSDRCLDRYVGKHPVLTPELIMVNNQPYGFRRHSQRFKGLEQFPIYCDIDYSNYEDEECPHVVESVDLYSELSIKMTSEIMSKLEKLAVIFRPFITIERTQMLGRKEEEGSILMFSRLGEIVGSRCLEEEVMDGDLTKDEVKRLLVSYSKHFINFIKLCDDVLLKGNALDNVDAAYLPE